MDSFDPRAGKLSITHVVTLNGQKDSQTELEVEPCDQKELTKSLYYDGSNFTNMTCIKDENLEELQGLLYDYNKTALTIDL